MASLSGAGESSQGKADKARRALRLAFFASGHGSALRWAWAAHREGLLASKPVVLLATKKASGALDFAKAEKIPAHIINPDDEAHILELLARAKPDLIILGGYLRKIGPKTLAAHAPYILNIHPSLLPAFGGKGMHGRRVHEAVLAAGAKESGASVHIVDGDYDRGPVIAQQRVPVGADDTVSALEARAMECEAVLLRKTLSEIETGKINLNQLARKAGPLL